MSDLASQTSVPLITSSEEITPSWMTTVLQAHGSLSEGQNVSLVTATDFGEDAGLMGSLYRAQISYEGEASGPASVVVKLPVQDEGQRMVADVLEFFNRECTFYAKWAQAAPYNTAEIYANVQDPGDSTDFVLVMEDLVNLSQIDQVAGASVEQIDAVVTTMAKQHAQYWDKPILEELSETFMTVDSPLYEAALPGVFAGSWEQTKEYGGAMLTEAVIAFGDRFGDHLSHLLASVAAPRTFVHGDCRGDNLMLSDDGELTVIDFQISGIAAGIYDIGYFMAQSVESDVRRANDDRVVALYCDTLRAEGIDVDEEATRVAYRTSFALLIIYATTSFQAWEAFDGRQHELMLKMLGRSVNAITENGSLHLLPELT